MSYSETVRQIFIGLRFFPIRLLLSPVYKKTSPRSDLRWKPKARILTTLLELFQQSMEKIIGVFKFSVVTTADTSDKRAITTKIQLHLLHTLANNYVLRWTDRGGEYMDTMYFQYVGIIHETNAPYNPQQNGISERKNRILKEMVNSMLSYSRLSKGAVVRLPDPKLKTLGEKGIEFIFVGYAEHSKAFRFYVIDPNDSVSINSINESRDAIFDKDRLSSVPRPSLRIPNETEDIGGSVVPEEVPEEVIQQPEPELRKSKKNRTLKAFGPEFQLYLIKGIRDEVSDQHSYCFKVEDDPKIFDEAMKSQDVTFWKD
ncbi:zinc finger, CCHC-type containing protein, partial [Tanacetum coccineum]